ncbi:MAG: helix-turn-helix transcriptional regulator [Lachnospiraceae bacterium]|nr:helix-turn-helix transcriptional regulator [Lachnospiraceae bacterium]
MELGKQIKKYRNEFDISQDELAEKIYVSRQTISNWENDKNYPDINSLLRLSEVFHVSMDVLIKGDIEEIKEEIRQEDMYRFKKTSNIFAASFFAAVITPIPLLHFLDNLGIGIWVALLAVTLWFGYKVEKEKKEFDIQSYKEIAAFLEGKGMDEIAKAKEEGKRPYQKFLLAMASALVTLAVAVLMMWILK